MGTRARAAVVGVAVLAAATGSAVGTGSAVAAPQDVALGNGGFEQPVIPVGLRTVHPGGDLGAWTVESGSVDLLHKGQARSPWVYAGDQAIDLTGVSAGVISQEFTTVPGHRYDVAYWVGSNQDGVRSGSAPESGDDWRVEVVGGTAPATRSGHWTGTGAGDAASGPADAVDGAWERWSLRDVTAAGTSMTLRFTSLEPGFYGVLLDEVAISTENRAPQVDDGTLTTAEDTPSAAWAPPTSDPDGDVVTYTATDPAHGTVTVSEDGTSLVYTPDVEHVGPDSFTVTGSDGHGGSDTGEVSVTVTPVRSPSTITNTRPSQGYGTNAKQSVVMHALVTSPDPGCTAERVVTFTVAPETAGAEPVTVLTDSTGTASGKFTLPEGEYTVTADLARTAACRSGSDTDGYTAERRAR